MDAMVRITSRAVGILCKWYVIAALVIIAAGVAARLRADAMPEKIVIPTAVMPHPNARDCYEAADALLRDTDVVGWALGAPTPLTPGVDPKRAADPKSGYHVFTLAEKDKLVAENQPAIAKLHEGMKHAYMQQASRSFDVFYPFLAKDRSMARLLALDAQTKTAHGDWAGAMTAELDCIKLGSDVPHGSNLIGSLVGIAIEAIGRRNAADAVDHLTAPQASAAARRMAAIDANEVPWSQAMQEEEWCDQSTLQKLFADPHWRAKWAGETQSGGADSNASSHPTVSIALSMESPKTAFDNCTHFMNAVVKQAKLSWPAQRAAAPPPMPTDPVNKDLVGYFAQGAAKLYIAVALDRLLETQLALRAYRLDHGSYPQTLSSLVPKYLPSLPLDPFSDSKRLHYRISADYYLVQGRGTISERYTAEHEARLSGDRYLLYSVGPDAVDDGGKPTYVPTRQREQLSVWYGEDKGDIVAGVNR
jgi:hypothetical protein